MRSIAHILDYGEARTFAIIFQFRSRQLVVGEMLVCILIIIIDFWLLRHISSKLQTLPLNLRLEAPFEVPLHLVIFHFVLSIHVFKSGDEMIANVSAALLL